MTDEANDPATRTALFAAKDPAMADYKFVAYLAERFPTTTKFAMVMNSLELLHSLHHCWLAGRAGIAAEFLASVLPACAETRKGGAPA